MKRGDKMNDIMTPQQRSKTMSHIRGKDTSIELMVRKYLYHHGYRYRKNVKKLPGTPDIVLTKQRIAIFVNGCFWHHHHNCQYATYPKSRKEYWLKKIERNVNNDIKHYQELEKMDYRVIIVWECELKQCFTYRMKMLIEEIENNELNM